MFGVGLAAGLYRGEAQTVRRDGAPPSLQAILADAATRSGTDPRNVQVVRIERTEWSDSGLGCPRPDELYSQVMTPGWLIEVRSGGKTFQYHSDTDDKFVLCAQR